MGFWICGKAHKARVTGIDNNSSTKNIRLFNSNKTIDKRKAKSQRPKAENQQKDDKVTDYRHID